MTEFIDKFLQKSEEDPLVNNFAQRFIGACSAFYGIFYDNLVNFDECISLNNLATVLSRIPSGESINEKLQRILIKTASLLYAIPETCQDTYESDIIQIIRYASAACKKGDITQYGDQLRGVYSFEFGIRISKDFELSLDKSGVFNCPRLLDLQITNYFPLKKLASPSTKKPAVTCGASAINENLFLECLGKMKRFATEMQSANRIKATDKATLAKARYEIAKDQAEFYLGKIGERYKKMLKETEEDCRICAYKQNTDAPTRIIYTPAGGKISR